MTPRSYKSVACLSPPIVPIVLAVCWLAAVPPGGGAAEGQNDRQLSGAPAQRSSGHEDATPSHRTASASAHAAKRKKKGFVTIATIGAGPVSVSNNLAPDQVVQRVIDHWRGRFAQVLPDRPDLIVVPECCDRPSGLTAEKLEEYYRVRHNRVREFFARVARENHCYMVYSAYRWDEKGRKRNSSLLIDREGHVVGVYNKNHPTIGEIEAGIVPGKEAPVFETDFGRVGMAICFDLNFDELRLRYKRARPDLIIFSSMYHGGLMQAYWAYSCRSHFVGAISGRSTPSQIYNPLGELVASTTNYFDFAVARVNLDCALAHLDYNWSKLRAMKEKYGPKVKITDPGRLGSVLIASEHQTIDVQTMIDEFQIERLDDYFARSLARRRRALANKP